MAKRALFGCLLIFFCMANALGQEDESYVKLIETKGDYSGEAFGPTVLQYHGYYLKDLFRVLDPAYAYEIDNKSLRRTRFTLDVQGDISDKAWIIEEMNKILREQGREVKMTERHPRIYTLRSSFPIRCDLKSGAASGESQFNQKWEGKCVELSRIMEKLHEWQPDLLIEIPLDVRVPSIKLEKSTVKDLQKQLLEKRVTMEVDEELSLKEYITVYR